MKKQTTQIREWLYLGKKGVTLRKISEVFSAEEGYETEIWEEAGVLEVLLPSGGSVDFEESQVREKDELLVSLLQKEGLEEVFLVTLGKDNFEEAKVVMQKVISHSGGIFCVDNEELEPVLRG
ncbi:MAG: hypothetical protein ACI4ES_02960 [Roseburia sp.]